MRIYHNIEELNRDLEIAKLRKDISLEELKMIKQDFKEDLAPPSWIPSILKFIGKIGMLKFAKKVV